MSAAVPRPIPIVMPGAEKASTVAVWLRVIERGHDDLAVRRIISAPSRRHWREELKYALDSLISEARLEVGVRHGTWICHVVPMHWHSYDSPAYPPPIARRIRHREPRDWRTITYDGRIDANELVLERCSGVPW